MNSIYRKSHVVTTYSLILIDLLVVAVSFFLAMILRFGGWDKVENRSIHLLFGVSLLVLSLLYAIMTDWNRDFFIRGYFREFVADLKHVILIALGGIVVLFIIQTIYALSRLVFLIFVPLEFVMMYAVHMAFSPRFNTCCRLGKFN